MWDPWSLSFSFLQPSHEVHGTFSATYFCTMCCCHRPKSVGPIDHGLKPPKPWARINLFSFKLNISDIHYSNRKLSKSTSRLDHFRPFLLPRTMEKLDEIKKKQTCRFAELSRQRGMRGTMRPRLGEGRPAEDAPFLGGDHQGESYI